jgi:hypothetical protein
MRTQRGKLNQKIISAGMECNGMEAGALLKVGAPYPQPEVLIFDLIGDSYKALT